MLCLDSGTIAAAAIESAGYVHCDLKPGNMFVSSNDPGGCAVRIFDFDLTKKRGEPVPPGQGTFGFMSPEVVHSKEKKTEAEPYMEERLQSTLSLFCGSSRGDRAISADVFSREQKPISSLFLAFKEKTL